MFEMAVVRDKIFGLVTSVISPVWLVAQTLADVQSSFKSQMFQRTKNYGQVQGGLLSLKVGDFTWHQWQFLCQSFFNTFSGSFPIKRCMNSASKRWSQGCLDDLFHDKSMINPVVYGSVWCLFRANPLPPGRPLAAQKKADPIGMSPGLSLRASQASGRS